MWDELNFPMQQCTCIFCFASKELYTLTSYSANIYLHTDNALLAIFLNVLNFKVAHLSF